MILIDGKNFHITTERTSYIFRLTPFGHLEHVYYGTRLDGEHPIEPLAVKRTALIGSSVMYDKSDERYCLDTLPLEWSGVGKGDYREAPAEIKMPDGSFTCDFVYKSHKVTAGDVGMNTLPSSYGADETLEITMLDESTNVSLTLVYAVYSLCDVIARRCVLKNGSASSLTIRKLMSYSLDMPDDGFELVTFDGGWIKEAHRHARRLSYGIYVNSSTVGASSNRHNPGFLLAAAGADEEHGRVYGFNLIYSGNHYGAVELSSHDLVRVTAGINPHCFEWTLGEGERFETPEAFMSFSERGFNGLSHRFHDFINRHVVRGEWRDRERPVLLNNWEAHFFRFSRAKLLRLARRVKNAGVELFVLDDGWFKGRDSDTAGLGDYEVNRRKLPFGLGEFARRIHGMGLMFGLWFEPEMVNEDSDLYRAHPDWALRAVGKTPSLGRNQLVLDLTRSEVRDYIVENVSRILDDCGVDYVKWDYNRHISDAQCFHAYTLGLYDVLTRIFRPRPHILFESCSSGGNRFDAGMLCFSPQIWASDDTDPVERLRIQDGLSYLYPLSSMGAHVSEAPHQQTLRATPLATRFNVAVFGCLGYELDLKYLTRLERREVAAQIAFYKEYRRVMQYGVFSRNPCTKNNKVAWQCVSRDGELAVSGFFQTLAGASEGFDRLRVTGLDSASVYSVKTRPQPVFIERFGGLVKHLLPVTLNPRGILLRAANKLYALTDCVEEYEASGTALEAGLPLNNQFMGSYYNDNTRLLGDYGSNLYVTKRECAHK